MIEFDDSEFPFVSVRISGDTTDQEYAAHLAALDDLRRTAEQRYVVMFDLSEARVPTGRQVRMQANWIRAQTRSSRGKPLAHAFVMSSPALRAALKALFTLQASTIPYLIIDTRHEARAVLQAYLDREREANSVA